MRFSSFAISAILVLTSYTLSVSAWVPLSVVAKKQSLSSTTSFINYRNDNKYRTSNIQTVTNNFRNSRGYNSKSRSSNDLIICYSEATSSRNSKKRDLIMYNSLTRTKEICKLDDDIVTMYTCGPTVYDYAHIGNFRAFLTYDVLKRVLMYLGYNVQHICNITDIDDKIIIRANNDKLENISELTIKYEQLFLHDLQTLNCIPACVYPRATEHIPVMIRFIQDLAINNNMAYETSDGSWYFNTQDYKKYGKQLVNLNYDDMVEQKETENENEKKHFADFCLWKAYKPGIDRNDAAWDSTMYNNNNKEQTQTQQSSDNDDDNNNNNLKNLKHSQPWPLSNGPIIKRGRPGWHLECSAMARTYFGSEQSIDFHGGGIDLKFPHHENEIAQSESVTNDTKFCNCWFHNGFVNIGDDKMSKSLGNFVTLNTACPKAIDVRAYRYLVISSQYRNPLRFTDTVMNASKKAIKRIDTVISSIEDIIIRGTSTNDNNSNNENSESVIVTRIVPDALESFEIAITDDLSMPRASAALFTLIKQAEKELKKKDNSIDIIGLKAILDTIKRMDQVFGIFYTVPEREGEDDSSDNAIITIPDEVMELVGQRSVAKEAKDWDLADSLRKRITELGFNVKDVKDGDPIITPVE